MLLDGCVPNYDGDMDSPNFYAPLTKEIARKKAANLFRHFQTKSNKHWFAEETFLGLIRLCGMDCAASSAAGF